MNVRRLSLNFIGLVPWPTFVDGNKGEICVVSCDHAGQNAVNNPMTRCCPVYYSVYKDGDMDERFRNKVN